MLNSVIELLYRTAAANPDGIAVSDERGEVSFRDLLARACVLSERLRDPHGQKRPVLVYLPKSAQAIASFAAILASGHFYVPADIKSPAERTKKIIEDLEPAKIVTQHEYEDQVRELARGDEKIVLIEDCPVARPGPPIQSLIENARMTTDRVIDTDPCYVMYTSGSTGAPKGVVIPHRGVIDYIDWACQVFRLGEGDVIGNQSPLFFDNSTLDIYLSWASGATLHLIPEKLFMFPIRLVEHLEKKKVSFIFWVPSVLTSFTRKGVLSADRLPDLKVVAFAGEVMPTRHLAAWQSALPGKRYVNLYGPTEITVDCTYFEVDRIYGPDESLPIGYPCRNSGILILGGDDRPAAPGENGELCVRGSSLALGYWRDPEKTGKAFTQNPAHDDYLDRIYRTGDIVLQREGMPIEFIGRKDSQIKHMGYRVELGEIEQAANSLSYISGSCAFYDQGKREIILFYESDRERSASQLINDLSQRIPSYMIPKKFRHFKKLPLNPSGKIDRKALINEFE